ncbi:uncharacterized protein LOC123318915 [Coccinella septempunctata]|uniref:uncharacterized protein LOC123318915 n=1 Tax=Coccinella septempunctata TaxID=41139 RepID=UPI001D07E143|nr:uncharacterized protein LOC123318915 [Coccinella septempunctata]
MLKTFILISFVAIAVAREKSQCETKHNIVKEDWDKLNADPSKPSEKMLCLFKCIYEEQGSTNSDGTINAEKLIENVNKWKPLNEDSKTYIKDCVKNLGPVKTCEDVNASFQCAQQAIDKQKQ